MLQLHPQLQTQLLEDLLVEVAINSNYEEELFVVFSSRDKYVAFFRTWAALIPSSARRGQVLVGITLFAWGDQHSIGEKSCSASFQNLCISFTIARPFKK